MHILTCVCTFAHIYITTPQEKSQSCLELKHQLFTLQVCAYSTNFTEILLLKLTRMQGTIRDLL